VFDRVPHQYLGVMCLGWAIVNADSPRRKLLVTAIAVLALADFAWRSEYVLVFPFIATLFLVASARVSLPAVAGRIVHVIAGASLFIYLTDHQIGLVLSRAGLGDHAVVMVVLAVTIGVAVGKVWEVTSTVAMRLQRDARTSLALRRPTVAMAVTPTPGAESR